MSGSLGEIMNCLHCGAAVEPDHGFCESCGKKIERAIPSAAPAGARSNVSESHNLADSESALNLRTWLIPRILFATEYGTLSLSDDHLIPKIKPRWRALWLDVLSRFFFWGFDPLSFFHTTAHLQLKNVSSAGLLSLRWVVWPINVLWVTGAGIFFIAPVSEDQIDKVQAFVQAIQEASTRAKYATVGTDH